MHIERDELCADAEIESVAHEFARKFYQIHKKNILAEPDLSKKLKGRLPDWEELEANDKLLLIATFKELLNV